MNPAQKPAAVRFSTKGRVVIPHRLRKAFGIEGRTQACMQSTPEGILIRPLTVKFIRALRGTLKGRGVLKALMADRKKEREL